MIELEVYAAGLRNIDKILELDHLLEAIPGLRYKVDRNHDLVYLEMNETAISLPATCNVSQNRTGTAFHRRGAG
jgi:hypothetical protein